MSTCLSKSSLDEVAETLSLVAQPLRLQILCMLSKQKKICVCEMIEKFHLKQNLISHHLGMLKRIGIVTTQRQGVKIFYSLDQKKYQKLQKNLQLLFDL